MPDPVREAWLYEVVRVRLPSGRMRYLIDVKREQCPHCATGQRTYSVWASTRGQAEAVAWCGHCFNATCDPVRLEDEQHARVQVILIALDQGRAAPPWAAVRPALEDLERRGLL